MKQNDKLTAIEGYLESLFPDCPIDRGWDQNTRRHTFRVDLPNGEIKHRIGFSSEFVDDNSLEEVIDHLDKWNLKGHLEQAEKAMVVVSNKGIALL